MTDIPGNQPPQGYPPQPYPPQQYPPPYPPVVYPPPKKGPSALKIVLIIIAIIVGLGIIGVGIVGYGVYRLAKSGNITTSSQPVTASDLGVALYPGAEQKANVRMTIAGKNVLTATFLSADSKDAR
jgi:flagellar basal body-associated protein FliL